MTFRELLESHNIPLAPTGHHHSREGWVQFDCPFCGKDSHHYHMGYNIQYGYFNCWQCGHHDDRQVFRALGFSPTETQNITKKVLTYQVYRGQLVVPQTKRLEPIHRQYLRQRGFNPDELEALWGIKATADITGPFAWRIYIPIHYRGLIVSWTTRSISNTIRPRYRSAAQDQESLPHRNLLYGIDYVQDRAIVCEGPLDVWRIGPGAVATFGIDFTREQVRELSHIPYCLICYDNEPTAQTQAHKLCHYLGPLTPLTVNPCHGIQNMVLDAKDPGSATPEEITKLRRWLRPSL